MTPETTIERTLRRLRARTVEQVVPPDRLADRCHFSPTGFALWEVRADGAPWRCTCLPCLAPEERTDAG